MIKSIFWNIRGINKKIALSRLQILKKSYNLQLLSICEPKVDALRIKEFQFKLGFHNALSNKDNRIWIFFQNDFAGSVLYESDQFVALRFSSSLFPSDFLCIFIHAHCSADKRKTLWNNLPQ